MADHHVCVVGAGISGLRCAAVLLQHGVRVTILEARQRIGGRIAQSSELGWPIDVGANWVHSTTGNPIIRLAAETNTPIHSWVPNTILVDSAGNLVEEDLANKTLDMVWQILERAAEHSQNKSLEIDIHESLYDFFEQASAEELASNRITEYQRELILGMAQMWGAYVGDAVDRQSLKFFFLEECVDAGQVPTSFIRPNGTFTDPIKEDQFIATTYQRILEKISEPVLSGANIQFGTRVEAVESSKDGVSVVAAKREKQLFNDVVITCPLGWLKRNISSISPMTRRLASAIESVSFGRLEKIFLTFPTPYWDQGQDGPTSFFHWNTPSSEIENDHGRCRMEAVSLAALSPPHNKSALLFYTFGDCSSHIASRIHGKSGDARFQIIVKLLEPYYSRLPNYNPATCTPIAALATEWSQDEFAGFGSYSNFQVGMTEADLDVQCMRHGMPEHHIWFAGEHTASFDGLGTVSGAYLSGERIAERIVEARRNEGQNKES